MRIDAHHHFWNYTPAEYGWIPQAEPNLRRDFGPADLQRELAITGIDGVVTVQARQTVEETRWLLELADAHAFIRGVVGWVPLISAHVADDLNSLVNRPKLRAVRHVLQDEPDSYLARDDFNRGISMLAGRGLVYDILIFERQLRAAIALVDRHPNQIFVLDHLAKPRIREHILQPWRDQMFELSRRQNVYCKLSGLITEADHAIWQPADLKPYVETALEAFGPSRLMFGTDWPVCLLAGSYERWHPTVSELTARLSVDEQAWLMGRTAIRAYNLK
jgi:L-fuconolactonase